MEASQIYILILIIVLLIIAFIISFFRKNKKTKRLTPLTGLSFGFVLSGIVFGDNKLIGYSLIGIGVLLAVVDMIINIRK